MDCCNYIEAYAAGGHFYQQQQQQYFCYDNGSAVYARYDAAPISSAIDINARYNGAIPSTYPTDYVYNPKEARLRKAMREQTRELSRRSILQSAIASANARTTAIGGASVVPASVASGGFLNQHHRFDCAPVSMGPNVSPHQAAEPWFQAAHRLKPAHSPRIGDWYGNVCGDPIERLQAMGAMHQHQQHQQQQQQQQRDLDKPIKDQRSQAECAAFSSNGYSPDIAAAEREFRRQESATEYADFVDGQKWHPYQSSASPHPHPRTPHPSPQMGGILHPNVQNTNAHGHAHGQWGQFCHGVLAHVPAMARNAAIRGPRHAVFLRDRTPSRHCAFSEDAPQMGYAPSKLNIDSIRASYPPPKHQMPRLLESAVDSVIDSTAAMNRREENDGVRWEPTTAGMSLDELVPTPQEGAVSREKEQRESRHSSERLFEPKKKPVSKQPLPGFHQAFGSTEIGRFSRSEFYVNMVGESGGGGNGNGNGDVGINGNGGDVVGGNGNGNGSGGSGNGYGSGTGDDGDSGEGVDDGDVSRERSLLSKATGNGVATAAVATATAATTPVVTAATVAATTTGVGRIFDNEDNQATFAIGAVGAPSSIGGVYRGQPTTPRWHSPHYIPEAYLTTPLLFPFPPTSRDILGTTNAVHGITEDGRLVSRILPSDCYWFAQSGRAMTTVPDGFLTCAALLDYSDLPNEREWIRRKATIAQPMEFPILLGNRNMECGRIINDRARRNYAAVGADKTRDREHESQAVNLKVDQDRNSLVGSSAQLKHELNEKKD